MRELLATARTHWRGALPDKVPPYSILEMHYGEVLSPRGVAFHPQLVEGPSTKCTLSECKDLVARALLEILDSRQEPVFYLGSTVDLIWRWRDITDARGSKCGHAYSKANRWWTQVALYLTESGDHCAAMEEHLIAAFKKTNKYARGRCQNAGLRGGKSADSYY